MISIGFATRLFSLCFALLLIHGAGDVYGQEPPSHSQVPVRVSLAVDQDALLLGRVLPITVRFANNSNAPVRIDPYWYVRGMGRVTRVHSTAELFTYQPAIRITRPDGTEVVTSMLARSPLSAPYMGPPGAERLFVELQSGQVYVSKVNLWAALENGIQEIFTQEGEYSISLFLQSDETSPDDSVDVRIRVRGPTAERHIEHLELIRTMKDECRFDLLMLTIDQRTLCESPEQIVLIQAISDSQEKSPYQDYARYWQLRHRYQILARGVSRVEMGWENDTDDDLAVRLDDLVRDLREFIGEVEATELQNPCGQLIERVVYSMKVVKAIQSR